MHSQTSGFKRCFETRKRNDGVVIRRQRLDLWSLEAGTCRQESHTDNGYEKEYETQSDEIFRLPDTPETIYY